MQTGSKWRQCQISQMWQNLFFWGWPVIRSFKFSFFVVFLVVYMITLIGNIGMIILISISLQLQSSMYFFLSPLSFVDVWFSSNVTLKMLENLLSEKKPFPMWDAWCSVTSSEPLSTWKYISWLWWPLIATWPSATLCFMAVKCPGLSVLVSSLWHTSMDSLLA